MKTKYLIIAAITLSACQFAIPEPLVERVRRSCEPYGGVETIYYQLKDEIHFTCNNGDKHVVFALGELDENCKSKK